MDEEIMKKFAVLWNRPRLKEATVVCVSRQEKSEQWFPG